MRELRPADLALRIANHLAARTTDTELTYGPNGLCDGLVVIERHTGRAFVIRITAATIEAVQGITARASDTLPLPFLEP
jgi:hypothetical protein